MLPLPDGNSWFGDLEFPIENWHRGLRYVADWAKSHANVVSMSLRNELRRSLNDTSLEYNWVNLVSNNTAATDAIHEVNPDILVSWSGMQDAPETATAIRSRLPEVPRDVQKVIEDAEAAEKYDTEAYQKATEVFFQEFVVDMNEAPPYVLEAIETLVKDQHVYLPSESCNFVFDDSVGTKRVHLSRNNEAHHFD